jgi:4-amino-4-deoxychorismate lyase
MILVNGQEAASIAVLDRGFQYGDGCFSTLEIRDGLPVLLSRHLQRLARDCAQLHIPCTDADVAVLADEARRLAAAGRDGVLKIILTRGAGGRGYRCPEPPQPSRVLSFHPRPVYPQTWFEDGVTVRLCRLRLGINPALAGAKHLNRLEQVLARQEWTDAETAEGLLLDAAGWVAEGTLSNVFWLRDGVLQTPRLDRCGVAGVMRELVLELAGRLGITVRQGRYRLPQVLQADEVFLTNSLIGLWPVRRLQERQWQPGPYTRRLAAAVEQAKQRESAACCTG